MLRQTYKMTMFKTYTSVLKRGDGLKGQFADEGDGQI